MVKRSILLGLAVAALAAVFGGASANGIRQQVANEKPTKSGVTIKARGSQYGKVLFSRGNRAIYYFDKESTSKPECYGGCAKAWPPVLTKGRPQAAGSVKQGLLGTKRRSNGKRQVTYDGHLLYFYAHDPKGEVLCHDIAEFGGTWLAVKPSGKPVPAS